MKILLPLTYFFLFFFLIYKIDFFFIGGISRRFLSLIFLLKIIFGLILWAIYTYYYTDRTTSDIFKYFDDAKVLNEIIKTHPIYYFQLVFGLYMDPDYLQPYILKTQFWDNPLEYSIFKENRIVIRFNAIVYLFSFGYYHVHTVVMNFVALLGLTAIYKTFYPIMKTKKNELIVVVFLIPSVLFWGSGVLKEGILLFALGFLIYYFHKIIFEKWTIKNTFWVIVSAFLLLLTKGYVVYAIIPSLISLVVIRMTGIKWSGLKFLCIHIIIGTLAFAYFRTNSYIDLFETLRQKQENFINVANTTKAGSFIQTKILEPTAFSVVKNTPEALLNTLLRPYLLEAKSPMILLSALENFIFILLILLSVFFFKKPTKEQLPLFYMSVFFVLILADLTGLITPILGAIVRYKVPFLPFLAIVFILLIDTEKIWKRIGEIRE